MSSAERLYERMRRSKAGWRLGDLHRLYVGFGFEVIEGRKHRLYIHPKYTRLRATVTRTRQIPEGYIVYAVSLITKLRELEGEQADG